MNEAVATQLGEMVVVIIGFFIFYWIMKKFAWGPVLNILDERQARIQESFEEVKRLQKDATEAHARYEEKLKGIETEARERINEAVNEGKRVAEQLTEDARAEARKIAEEAKVKMNREMGTIREELRRDVIRLTIQTTEKILQVKVDEAKDRELIEGFIGDLESRDYEQSVR